MSFQEKSEHRNLINAMRHALCAHYPCEDVAEFSETEVVDTYHALFSA